MTYVFMFKRRLLVSDIQASTHVLGICGMSVGQIADHFYTIKTNRKCIFRVLLLLCISVYLSIRKHVVGPGDVVVIIRLSSNGCLAGRVYFLVSHSVRLSVCLSKYIYIYIYIYIVMDF